jgi:hypothetical protein
MDKREIKDALATDPPAVREAVERGLIAAYGNWDEVEVEYSGHIHAIITAVRAAVAPLIYG